MKLFQDPRIQKVLERLLYIWAIRHPASGYVQGINDIATPFMLVFMCSHTGLDNIESVEADSLSDEVLQVRGFLFLFLSSHFVLLSLLEGEKMSSVCCSSKALQAVEADTFWCLTKLIDSIQDHYTFAQPGRRAGGRACVVLILL